MVPGRAHWLYRRWSFTLIYERGKTWKSPTDLFPTEGGFSQFPTLNIGRDFSWPAWKRDLDLQENPRWNTSPDKIFIRKQWQFLLNSKTLVAPEAGSYKAIKCGTGHFIREGGFRRHVGKISLSMAPSPFITVRLSDYNVIPSPPMLLRLSDIVICHIYLPASLSTDDQVWLSWLTQCFQIFVTIP